MNWKEAYVPLSKYLNYWQLCYIEDALLATPPKNEWAKERYDELLMTVRAARGWLHEVGKTDGR